MEDFVKKGAEYFTSAWTKAPSSAEAEKLIVKEVIPKSGSLFVRVAGLSGLLATGLGAYGAHAFKPSEHEENLKQIYETGNRYHFFHSIALLAVPLTKRPYIVGPLWTMGMLLFSGSCYYHALTGNTTIRKVTPFGGMLLMAGWIAVIL